MPYSRKYRKFSRPLKITKTKNGKIQISSKAKPRVPRPLRLNIKGIHYFTRSYATTYTFTMATATDGVGGVLTEQLSNVPNPSEFGNLFDQFKLLSSHATMRLLQGTVKDISNVSAYAFPSLFVAPDLDDDAVPTTLSSVLERKYKQINFGNKSSVVVKLSIPPYLLIEGEDLDGGNPRYIKKSPWVDMADYSAKHGCLKLFLHDPFNTGTERTYHFEVIHKLHFLCRSVR